jgi:hypothetical protein
MRLMPITTSLQTFLFRAKDSGSAIEHFKPSNATVPTDIHENIKTTNAMFS